MTSCKKLETQFDDPNKHKWCIPLKEEVFSTFMAKGDSTVHKVFGDGSFFSPLLFGKFFDPSDAFPIWEFDASVLLCSVRSSGQNSVDWFQTNSDYVLKAEIPGSVGKNSIQVCVDDGKVVEISGDWRQPGESCRTKDWRCSDWWEHGYVRRLELPANADGSKTEATLYNDKLLEIRVPKTLPGCSASPEH